MKQHRTLLVASTLIVALAACGSDGDGASSDGDDPKDRIAALFAEAGAPEDEARCVADNLDADITPEQVEDYITQVIQSDEPADLLEDGDTDVALAIGLAVNECDL